MHKQKKIKTYGIQHWRRLDSYPLVNIQKTMENHYFSWENPLFLWPLLPGSFRYVKCFAAPWSCCCCILLLTIEGTAASARCFPCTTPLAARCPKTGCLAKVGWMLDDQRANFADWYSCLWIKHDKIMLRITVLNHPKKQPSPRASVTCFVGKWSFQDIGLPR